jgi:Fibronectin type III domain
VDGGAIPYGGFALFIADRAGGIRKTSSSDPPATPENPLVTSVTAHTIDISWTESNPASVELDGFVLYLRQRTNGGETGTNTIHGPADRTASFTDLHSGAEYKFQIEAFNANGYSAKSTPVVATTPIATETVIVSLLQQQGGPTYVPYAAKYPPFGAVPAGHVTQITLPNPGVVPRVGFVKTGHSTEQCGDPNAVVIINAGQTTGPAQMTAIFGVPKPPFSTASPIGFVACVDGGNLPGFIQIELTIVSDG